MPSATPVLLVMDFQDGIVERLGTPDVADADPEVHRVLIEKVFPRRAVVATTGEWMATLPA
ncbi:hypothetical protein [Cryobacterium tepidiphilum]|uniref:hypothetical protein n=1 Tax=Cryobacterium tepidiphilum TaxID=2486026 RepID=UPI001F1A2B1C|nr:hypothetical protein [Cryobacterium tepidiphilum]